MSNLKFNEVDAHKVISISLNKIANFRIQRGGPKLFKDLLVANLIQKAKILVVDEIYSSSRNLTLNNSDSDLPETNLDVENDVFELEEKESFIFGQGLTEPRLQISLQGEECEIRENKDDVGDEEVCNKTEISKNCQNVPKEEDLNHEHSEVWDENNKENEPLGLEEASTAQTENECITEGNLANHKHSMLDSVEFSERSNNSDMVLYPVNLKDTSLAFGITCNSDDTSLYTTLKRKFLHDEECLNNHKKCKRNVQLNSDSFGRKWRASSLSRPLPRRTKHSLKRHRSRDWSFNSFDTDSDDDESFSDLKPFSKLKLKEGIHQPSALTDSKLEGSLTILKNDRTDEEQIVNLSNVFSSSFDGLGFQHLSSCPKTTFTFSNEKVVTETRRKNSVTDVCSKQAKITFQRVSQSIDNVAVTA